MFLPLSLGALIVVILVAPFYWAADHPWLAAAAVIGFVWSYCSIARWCRKRRYAKMSMHKLYYLRDEIERRRQAEAATKRRSF